MECRRRYKDKPVPEFWSISTRQWIRSGKYDEHYKPRQRLCSVPTVRGDCHVDGHLVSPSRGIRGMPTQRDDISPSLESTPNSVPKNKIWDAGGDTRKNVAAASMCFSGEVSRETQKFDIGKTHVPIVLAATVYILAIGRRYIIVFNWALYMKDTERTLLIQTSANILEHEYKTIHTIIKIR